MIEPTRINLLFLKQRKKTLKRGVEILRTKRNALIKEFIKEVYPLIKTRKELSGLYRRAIMELQLAQCKEGREAIDSIVESSEETLAVHVETRIIWGLRYKEILFESPLRSLDKRPYDPEFSSVHLDEAIYSFEKLLHQLLELLIHEKKVRVIGEEIARTNRKIRLLEERIIPRVESELRYLSQYLNEREREDFYKLKLYKGSKSG